MKIIYCVHQFFPEFSSGTERVVLNLSNMTQKNGHQVKVITFSSYEDSFYDQMIGGMMYKEFIYKGIPVIAFKSPHEIRDLNFALAHKQLSDFAREILVRESPDVVHFSHFMRVGEFSRTARELNIPYVITLTDFFLACPKVILSTTDGSLCVGPEKGGACQKLCPELSTDFIRNRLALARDILVHASKIVAPSFFLAEIFTNEFPELQIEVVHHGISGSHTKVNMKTYSVQDELTFCYAGSIVEHKGVHLLIDAFKRIESQRVSLKIYGPAADSQYFDHMISEIKGDNRIQYCGEYTEQQIGDIFSNMDVMVIPSTCYESYSLILHEALKSKVPVIAAGIGSIPEKVKDGINGLLSR